MPGSTSSNAPKNNNFAPAFMNLKLRREFKKDHIKVRESKAGIGLRARSQDYALSCG